MLSEREVEEITAVIGAERVEASRAYSVERERQRYSDDALWARLYDLDEREIEILKQLPLAYRLAHSGYVDYKFWQSHWLDLVNELEAGRPTKELYAWHLSQRGNSYIGEWIKERDIYKKSNAITWQRSAWN